MTEPADRDGMFTDPRPGDRLISVVTCTWCGCVVADTEAHRPMHTTADRSWAEWESDPP